ncbi:hypothetical protein NKH24_07005 [Mesorhizobium sp. M1300]|uniref:hypothetical protein n=1 Tax=Mesorhizobium sp. M1300 TaxID=2957077 RepID=UPI00333793B0
MDLQRTLDFYTTLMEEVKVRTATIDAVLAGQLGEVPPYIPGEIAYLQLRLICESIALGSLAIHNEIEATASGKLVKAYSAEFILKRLEALHAKFYPAPFVDKGGEFVKPDVDYLTQKRLIDLYHECNVYLHRGTMKTLEDPKTINFENIRTARNRIVALLNHHQTLAVDERWMFTTMMNGRREGAPAETPGKVHVLYWEKASPPKRR